jgi:uncharacterized membrane protein (Fun14 family)
MVSEYLQPMAYIFTQGALLGLVVGFAFRKLNKLIAAVIGLALLAVNLLGFVKMMEIKLPIPQLDQLAETILQLLPFAPTDLTDRLGPMMPLLTSLPFIGGAVAGAWIGFKLA